MQTEEEKGSTRPPLEGHTATVDALYMVANQIRSLIGAITQTDVELIEGPQTPSDWIKATTTFTSHNLVDSALGTPKAG